jgi:glycosyltransferase involved in cell wall biosynthesis
VRAKLTALIPCKDERRNIRLCIESLQPIADEILVADSGSTDGTLDIVRDIGGCRVVEREYITSANFKNWAIPQSQFEWVLLLDADERLTPALAGEIRSILAEPPADKDGFWIDRANHYLGYRIRHCGWNSDAVIRLFRRQCRYQTRGVNAEHAEVEIPPQRVGQLRNPMLHYTTWNSDHHLKKLMRYAHFGAVDFEERGRPPSTWRMITRAPIRFLQLYFLRLGILDGLPGFQVCMHTAFYSFLKQAKHWELHYALQQPDPEVERTGQLAESPSILTFPQRQESATHRSQEATRQRRAA